MNVLGWTRQKLGIRGDETIQLVLVRISHGDNRASFDQVFRDLTTHRTDTLNRDGSALQFRTAIDVPQACAYRLHDTKGRKMGDLFFDRQAEHMRSFQADHLHIVRIRADVFPGNIEAAKSLDEATERTKEGFTLLSRVVFYYHAPASTEIHPGSGSLIGHAASESEDIVNRLLLRRV